MVIQHNLSASNANRMLNLSTANIAKSTEKLSSGYKINRAADDAAGLSISEKMRKQIRALNQASNNAQDGISMVQTAEGALNEVHDMLHRMNELAVKAANGTMSSSDRADVQAEVEQLLTEIDRVSSTTKFNEVNLLDGDVKLGSSIADMRIKKGATADITVEKNNVLTDFVLYSGTIRVPTPGSVYVPLLGYDVPVGNKSTAGISGKINANSDAVNYLQDPNNVSSGFKNSLKGLKDDSWDKNTLYPLSGSSRLLDSTCGFYKDGDSSIQIFSKYSNTSGFPELNNYLDADGNLKSGVMYFSQATLSQPNGSPIASLVDDRNDVTENGKPVGSIYLADGSVVSMSDLKEDIERNANGDLVFKDSSYQTKYFLHKTKHTTMDGSAAVNQLTEAQLESLFDVYEAHHSLSVSLQVGADNLSDNRINVEIRHMNRVTLGLTGLDMSTVEGARQAIDLIGGDSDGNISGAIKECSKERSKLGAVQNRLEHTIRNLDNVVENTTAAESQIRDTDMATEMVKFSKERILQQAGQSVLAQAQQSNQGVLALLG